MASTRISALSIDIAILTVIVLFGCSVEPEVVVHRVFVVGCQVFDFKEELLGYAHRILPQTKVVVIDWLSIFRLRRSPLTRVSQASLCLQLKED